MKPRTLFCPPSERKTCSLCVCTQCRGAQQGEPVLLARREQQGAGGPARRHPTPHRVLLHLCSGHQGSPEPLPCWHGQREPCWKMLFRIREGLRPNRSKLKLDRIGIQSVFIISICLVAKKKNRSPPSPHIRNLA